jgi:predicted XRE-type DNA-binding protein
MHVQSFTPNIVCNTKSMSVQEAFMQDLRDWMKFNKKSDKQLAEKLGITPQHLSDVLNNRTNFSTPKMFEMLTILNKKD